MTGPSASVQRAYPHHESSPFVHLVDCSRGFRLFRRLERARSRGGRGRRSRGEWRDIRRRQRRRQVFIYLPRQLETGTYAAIAYDADANENGLQLRYHAPLQALTYYGKVGQLAWVEMNGKKPELRFSDLELVEQSNGTGTTVTTLSGALVCDQPYE